MVLVTRQPEQKWNFQTQEIGVGRALLCSLPMFLLTAFMSLGAGFSHGLSQWLAVGAALVFVNILFFLMVKTGRTDRYRTIFFVVMSICFVISFISSLVEMRGSMSISKDHMIQGETPFCHLVIPVTLIPAALTKTIIFPGHLLNGFAPIAGMFVIWLGASLVLGRGWCSWVCFFGGLDEGCSRLRKKARIKSIDKKWTYLPHAVLLGIVLTSALAMSPMYCEWLCPFKAVTEFAAVTSFKILVQTVLFGSLFLALVIVLPILTRRRIQCGLFCPFASFQSFTNKTNVFEVSIDPEKCTECGHCIKTCPTFSLDEESVEKGRARLSCTKCGHCVDHCPKQAVSFHIKGTPLRPSYNLSRLLFLYPAFLFGATMGMGSMAGAMERLLKWTIGLG
jgi:ferredoxin-type protein NapH